MITKPLCLALTLALVSGCASSARNGAATVKFASDGVREVTLVRELDACPSETEAWTGKATGESPIGGMLLGALVGPLVEKAVDAGAQYLVERNEALSASTSARRNLTFYRAKNATDLIPNLGCIVFVRGNVGPNPVFAAAQARPAGAFDAIWTEGRVGDFRRLYDIPLVAAPSQYAEFVVEYDGVRKTGGVEPQTAALRLNRLDYRKTGAKRVGSGIKDLVFTFVFEAAGNPGETGVVKRYAKFDVAMGQTAIGTLWEKDALLDRVSTI